LLLFKGIHLHYFSKIKRQKEHKIVRFKGFLIIFAWWWNSDLDPYFWLVDPDPGCPKTCESGGSGSGALENKPWRSQRKGDIKNVFAAWPAWPTKVSFSVRNPQKRQEYPEYQNMTMLGYACGLLSSLYTKSIAFTLKNYASFVPSFLYLKSWHR